VEGAGALCEVVIPLVLVVRVAREGDEDKIVWGFVNVLLRNGDVRSWYRPQVFERRISPVLVTRCSGWGIMSVCYLCVCVCYLCIVNKHFLCRSQWPRGLSLGSAAACLLELWFRISPRSWMSCLLCVLFVR